MKLPVLKLTLILVFLYFAVCVFLYFFQEQLIFFPEKLSPNHQFNFENKFEEFNVETEDGVFLSNLLFKAENPKGVIFYLHGNGGSLNGWREVAKVYTDLNYDVLMCDYRGYGKSEGKISSEKQFFSDIQLVYDELKKDYPENQIIVLGYSIGTGTAAKIAADNHPKLLILQAPYYSLTDLVKKKFPFVPSFLLRYKFETYKYLRKCEMPVVIFHGNQDEVIGFEFSLKLKKEFKESDKLITLKNQGHNNMSDNPDYLKEIEFILK